MLWLFVGLVVAVLVAPMCIDLKMYQVNLIEDWLTAITGIICLLFIVKYLLTIF